MKGTTFMEKCKGIALIMGAFSLMLFGGAALIHSASPAQASEGPQMVHGAGKYQMTMTATTVADQAFWLILAWDTETGRSRLYYGTKQDGTSKSHSGYQLPSSPL